MAGPSPAQQLLAEASCPVCLELFQDPVSIPCGHNFCRGCIERCWENSRDLFPCPRCRDAAPERSLRPNRELGHIADIARGMLPAVPGTLCGRHRQPLRFFCREERALLCLVCGRCRLHRVVPAEEAAQEYEEQIQNCLQALKEEREKYLESRKSGAWRSFHQDKARSEGQRMVREFQELRRVLEEQERLLLEQLGSLDGAMGRAQDQALAKVSEELSQLDTLIWEMEGKFQQPPSLFLQDIQQLLDSCERMKFHPPAEISPDLERSLEDFIQRNILTASCSCCRSRTPPEPQELGELGRSGCCEGQERLHLPRLRSRSPSSRSRPHPGPVHGSSPPAPLGGREGSAGAPGAKGRAGPPPALRLRALRAGSGGLLLGAAFLGGGGGAGRGVGAGRAPGIRPQEGPPEPDPQRGGVGAGGLPLPDLPPRQPPPAPPAPAPPRLPGLRGAPSGFFQSRRRRPHPGIHPGRLQRGEGPALVQNGDGGAAAGGDAEPPQSPGRAGRVPSGLGGLRVLSADLPLRGPVAICPSLCVGRELRRGRGRGEESPAGCAGGGGGEVLTSLCLGWDESSSPRCGGCSPSLSPFLTFVCNKIRFSCCTRQELCSSGFLGGKLGKSSRGESISLSFCLLPRLSH
ncbi:E3 ubiquitin-protein ligase TRIM8-like isoform X1 [Cinclus cinclus]|uniref:E3 ubiquitin-protein ligase TRIM8-like isoform X1 n=1 Tax=Cinclus cinclus TaxID=127875 RepID=UPI002E14D7CE